MPAIMPHLNVEFGKNIVAIALIKNNSIINGNVPKESIVRRLTKAAVITSPIPVFLKILMKVEAKNIKTKVLPIPSKL